MVPAMPPDPSRPDPVPAEWLPVAEAARRLGVSEKAVRNRIKRGTLDWRPAGNHGREVLATGGGGRRDRTGPGPRTGPAGRDGTGPGADLGRLVEAGAELGRELSAALPTAAADREARARAEGRAEVLDAALAKAEGRADRLETALAEARRPWLAK